MLGIFVLKNDLSNFSTVLSENLYFPFRTEYVEYILLILVFVLWLWITNLFNFMDGMDGITAVQTFTFGVGIILLSIFNSLPSENIFIGTILLCSSISLFYWNRPPAKIFLGDVGAVPLGFIIASIIIVNLLKLNNFIPLIILILFHLSDSSLT